jgi:hypothetical protein
MFINEAINILSEVGSVSIRLDAETQSGSIRVTTESSVYTIDVNNGMVPSTQVMEVLEDSSLPHNVLV